MKENDDADRKGSRRMFLHSTGPSAAVGMAAQAEIERETPALPGPRAC